MASHRGNMIDNMSTIHPYRAPTHMFRAFHGCFISSDKTTRLKQQENNMHISAIHGHFYRELQGLLQWFLPTGSSLRQRLILHTVT